MGWQATCCWDSGRCQAGRRCDDALPFRPPLRGSNAAVVGILLTVLYRPIWISSIHTPFDFALAAIAFALLMI